MDAPELESPFSKRAGANILIGAGLFFIALIAALDIAMFVFDMPVGWGDRHSANPPAKTGQKIAISAIFLAVGGFFLSLGLIAKRRLKPED